MNQTPTTGLNKDNVAISELAREFGRDLHTFHRWLLRNEFCINRRQNQIAILTAGEAAKARFLNAHGVIVEIVSN